MLVLRRHRFSFRRLAYKLL